MIDFSERLKTARIAKGLSQEAVGTAIGVTKAAISSMERGITNAATPEHLFKMSQVLECDPEWLALGTKPQKIKEKREPYITNKEKQIIDNFRMLSRGKQEKALSFIDGLLSTTNKK